ncbi:MAG: hypothetical protein FWD29_04145 [Micrococcales bacterium]|nr:hypothetical protein [Micrococcales bacterium]
MTAGSKPRKWLKPLIITTSIALVLALGAGLAVWLGQRQGTGQDKAEIHTAQVELTSLTAALELTGSLGYGKPQDLGGGGGIVTKVPKAGQECQAGEVLLETEGKPVFLLHGDTVMYRDIKAGTSGPDVTALRAALTELKYDAGAASPIYDAALSKAIDSLYANAGYASPSEDPEAKKAKQEAEQALIQAKAALSEAGKTDQAALAQAEEDVLKAQRELANPPEGMSREDARGALRVAQAALNDLKAPRDTSAEQAAVAAAQQAFDDALLTPVGPKDILMVPTETLRVDQVKVNPGAPADSVVVTWTDTTIFANVELTDAQRASFSTGAEVKVTLSNGEVVDGKVGELTESTVDEMGQFFPAKARIDIEDQDALAEVGLGSVKVDLVQDTANEVLVVPVTALVALAEGGYAVELKDGTLVGVDVGLVADTRAAITPTTGELNEGDEVIIP